MKVNKILDKIMQKYSDYEYWFEERESWDPSPVGYLEGFTLYLIEIGKLDISVWTELLNDIYDPNNREVYKGIEYSLEVLYLEKKYTDYLLGHLRPELKDMYNNWIEYYKN